jgi:hypothetical protein
MTFFQFLTVSAGVVGLVIIAVMAAIPFLTDEPFGRSGSGRFTGGRTALAPPAHPPR